MSFGKSFHSFPQHGAGEGVTCFCGDQWAHGGRLNLSSTASQLPQNCVGLSSLPGRDSSCARVPWMPRCHPAPYKPQSTPMSGSLLGRMRGIKFKPRIESGKDIHLDLAWRSKGHLPETVHQAQASLHTQIPHHRPFKTCICKLLY